MSAPVLLAAYIRVSKEDGTQKTANQRPQILAWAKRHKLKVAIWYVEEKSAVKRRPVFERMMRELKAGRADRLIVWALDRFGRTFREGVVFTADLEERGILVHSVQDEWLDATGPFREPLRGLMFKIAEQERSRLIERTKAGLARARAEGVQLGRGRVPVDALEVVRQFVQGGKRVDQACKASMYLTRAGLKRNVSPAAYYRWRAEKGNS